jgi:uroporphyrinogen decarboxylase
MNDRPAITPRARFLDAVLGRPVDRPPYWLFWGVWARAWDYWAQTGKPEHIANMWDVRAHFGADQPPAAIPVNCGPCPPFERTIVAEDDDYVTFYDSWGILRRDYKHAESMSQFLEFPVQTRGDWERFKAERLDPHHPGRLAGPWRELCAGWTARGWPIQLGSFPDVGLFGTVRWLLGDEEGLVAFYTMPDLVREIMDHMTTLYLVVFEQVVREVRVDVIHLWEDMCSRNGPLISPAHWEAFLGPQYRRIKAFADRHQIPVISVDTDGDPGLIAGCMIDAGVNLLFPMEVAAGCDVVAWRERYPELALLGGIDKRALVEGPDAIRAELERVRPAIQGGRYIPALDHLVPDNVPWDHYACYAEALRALVGAG